MSELQGPFLAFSTPWTTLHQNGMIIFASSLFLPLDQDPASPLTSFQTTPFDFRLENMLSGIKIRACLLLNPQYTLKRLNTLSFLTMPYNGPAASTLQLGSAVPLWSTKDLVFRIFSTTLQPTALQQSPSRMKLTWSTLNTPSSTFQITPKLW